MGVDERLAEFAGLRVVDFPARDAGQVLPQAGSVAWRVASEPEETPFDEVWARFLDSVETSEVTALVIGFWGDDYDEPDAEPVIASLAEAAERFPALRALFFGDIAAEESDISRIDPDDITPLFTAFPRLEHFAVCGGYGMSLDPISSGSLATLRFESGGLPADVVRAVAASDLPRLEHLDLWFGAERYGGDATVADLAPLLSGERFPALRHLGLEDSEFQDEIAVAVASAPVVARLESLSLAMGVLSDEGAEALLSGQPLTHLKRLDLHHHFLTEPMMARVRAALPGVEVDLSYHRDSSEDARFVMVSE